MTEMNEAQDLWAMSPEAATEKLAQIAKDYAASTGQALPQASTPTVEDLLKMQEASEDARDAAMLADFFVGAGLPASEPAGAEVLAWASGKSTIPAEMRKQAQARMDALSRNPEYVKALLQGGTQEMKMLTIASAMLAAPIEGSAR